MFLGSSPSLLSNMNAEKRKCGDKIIFKSSALSRDSLQNINMQGFYTSAFSISKERGINT